MDERKEKLLKGTLLGGVVMLIVSAIIGGMVQLLFPFSLSNLSGIRPLTDPIHSLYFFHFWILAFAMTWLYPKLNFKGTFLQKGKFLGLTAWLFFTLPSALMAFSTTNYPFGFFVDKIIGGILSFILAGIAIARLID